MSKQKPFFLVVNQSDPNRGEELSSTSSEVIDELSGRWRDQMCPEDYRVYCGDSADIWIRGDDVLRFGEEWLLNWYTEVFDE